MRCQYGLQDCIRAHVRESDKSSPDTSCFRLRVSRALDGVSSYHNDCGYSALSPAGQEDDTGGREEGCRATHKMVTPGVFTNEPNRSSSLPQAVKVT
jgi:hypothetical protein